MITTMSKPNGLFLLSGGLDSQVLLAEYRTQYAYAHCVGFNYGQRHVRELQHAYQISRYYGATWQVVELPRLTGSVLTGDGDVPKGFHYADPKQAATVVPGRNAVMLAHAVSIAAARGDADVLFAAHAGDAAVYADCRHGFVDSFSKAMRDAYGVTVRAPFLAKTKRDIVALGRSIRCPLEDSWSCYEGGAKPCGECGSCCERREAMS